MTPQASIKNFQKVPITYLFYKDMICSHLLGVTGLAKLFPAEVPRVVVSLSNTSSEMASSTA